MYGKIAINQKNKKLKLFYPFCFDKFVQSFLNLSLFWPDHRGREHTTQFDINTILKMLVSIFIRHIFQTPVAGVRSSRPRQSRPRPATEVEREVRSEAWRHQ